MTDELFEQIMASFERTLQGFQQPRRVLQPTVQLLAPIIQLEPLFAAIQSENVQQISVIQPSPQNVQQTVTPTEASIPALLIAASVSVLLPAASLPSPAFEPIIPAIPIAASPLSPAPELMLPVVASPLSLAPQPAMPIGELLRKKHTWRKGQLEKMVDVYNSTTCRWNNPYMTTVCIDWADIGRSVE